MNDRKITILCSGVALGVYIPALLLEYHLRQLGLSTDVALLEDLYHPEGKKSLEKLRGAFQERFDLARIAQRMTKSMRPHLAPESVNALLRTWHHEDRRDFIVWSGFWMPLLEDYRALRAPHSTYVDICRIDAKISPSFRSYQSLDTDDQEIWFWNWSEKRLEHELAVTSETQVPFENRDDRFVIHGGGWGLGEHREVARDLEKQGICLDKVLYRQSEVEPSDGISRSFMVQPDWRPWRREAGLKPEFPPFGEVTAGVGDGRQFVNRAEYHELYRIIRRSRAIISKPGGGTLMDSLSSATPVVMLEPYGTAEQSNADLWKYLGFGISYEDWKKSGYDETLLAQLSDNLLNRKGETIDYPRSYAERVERRVTNNT